MSEFQIEEINWHSLDVFFDTHFGDNDSPKMQRRFALACTKKVLPSIDKVFPHYTKHWALYEIGKKRDNMSRTTYGCRINKWGKIADEISHMGNDLDFTTTDKETLNTYSAAWEAAWTVQFAVGLVGNPWYDSPMTSAAAEASIKSWSCAGNCPLSVSSKVYWLPEEREWQYELLDEAIWSIKRSYVRGISRGIL